MTCLIKDGRRRRVCIFCVPPLLSTLTCLKYRYGDFSGGEDDIEDIDDDAGVGILCHAMPIENDL